MPKLGTRAAAKGALCADGKGKFLPIKKLVRENIRENGFQKAEN